MNLVQDVEAAASATAAATASKVTVTGAGVSGFGWLMNSEWLAVLGAVVAVLGCQRVFPAPSGPTGCSATPCRAGGAGVSAAGARGHAGLLGQQKGAL